MTATDTLVTSAHLCRSRGWHPGTVLVGDEGSGPQAIVVTAVGEAAILARQFAVKRRSGEWVRWPASEAPWALSLSRWARATADELAVLRPLAGK